MKKHLLFALALSCAAFSLTACHDDDDENGDGGSDYIADYTNPKVNTNYAFDKIAGASGVSTFTFSDAQGYTDVYHYSTDGNSVKNYVTEECKLPTSSIDSLSGSYYGGFYNTWFTADNEDEWFTPINGTYHSGRKSALLCNPGTLCKAFFGKHLNFDLSTVLAKLTVGDAKCLYVCPTDIYSYLEPGADAEDEQLKADNRDILGLEKLPANTRVEFTVYGYIESFRFTDWKSFLTEFKKIATDEIRSGGHKGTSVTIASADAEGKVTVNKEWQKVDLSSIGHCYLFEAYLSLVDANGKAVESTVYDFANSYLNYVIVDDITYESKSIF